MQSSKDTMDEDAVGASDGSLPEGAGPRSRPLRGLRKWLLVLLLVSAGVVALLYFAPLVHEEMHPVKRGMVLWRYTNNGWVQGEDGQRVFSLEMSFVSEDPFGIQFYRVADESVPPQDGQEDAARDSGRGRATIAEYTLGRRALGHNYKVSVSVRVHGDVIAIRADQGEWVEHRLFADSQKQRSCQLASIPNWDSLPLGEGGDRLFARDLGIGLLHLVYSEAHPKSQPPEQREMRIWVELNSPE